MECTLGQTCFVEDYKDRDAETGAARDFTCGLNVRDAHNGTDIALPVWDNDDSGVAVLAAAPGTVRSVRDGMADDWRMAGVTSERACGNLVMINHSGGVQTLYCHLANGSVSVEPGDTVARGTPLGHIGISGQTTHPHLHFGLRYKGAWVDPFDAERGDCGTPSRSLWSDTPPYHATLLRNAGFSTSPPDYPQLRDGSARMEEVSPSDPLVVYAEAGLAQHGDRLTVSAIGPDGTEIFSQTRTMENPRKSQLPFLGRRAPEGGWPAGDYRGQITLTRDGVLIANRWAHVTVR